MNVSYPTDNIISKDYPFGTSLQNGFFPIGFYHCWHGGVHIEGKGKKVKAIADGKIIAFRYSKNEIEVGTKDGKPISLYNNFVLMRHDYKSGSHTLTLYSLYYHLFFGEEKPAPPQEKKYKAVPAVNGGYKLSGIWSVDKTLFFPTHTALNIKEEKEDYYVVNGKDINNVPQKEIRIPKTYGNEKKPTVNKGKVRWTSIAYKDQKGILLYYTEGESKIARKAIAVGSTVTVKNDSDAEWIEILYEGEVCFLKKGELKDGKLQEVTTDSAKTPSKPNKNNNFPPFLQNQKLIEGVQTCDIAVKAGELIGYVGKQGIYNQPDYYATHLEVFTPGNYNKVNEKGDIIDRMGMYQFIHNIKNDKYIEGAGQKRYFELKKGTVLKPYLKVSSEDYKGVIITIDPKKKTENYTQVIPTQIIKELPENSYEKPIGKRNGKNFHYRDIVTHKRKAFWVRNNYIEEVPRKREKNKVDYKLKGDTPCLYLTNPDEETKYRDNEQQKRICEFKNTLSRMVLIDKSKCKEITYEGKKWLYVKSYYYEGNKIIYNYGWIEHPKEEELFSAHCWNKFGFSCQDAEDHRIYPIKGVNHYSGTSEFINKMISLLDENGDRIIDNKELRAKYNSPDTYHILSKMVCKHQSEWSYSWERIKEDAKAYFKYHFPKAKDAEIEKKLEFTEKVFDATYTFWGELKDKLSGQDKTFFKEGIFWYFEPFAWVTQMKKVFIPDIDLSDPDKWISQFTQPRPNFACYRTCCLILNNYGITCGGLGDTLKEKYSNGSSKFSNVIQVVVQKSDGTLENTGDEKEAIDYINSELEKGHPIVVGVDKEGEKKDLNYDHTTEHFIVITGRKTDEKGIYYRFFDVGTHSENKNLKGINPNNRLYLQEDYNLIGNIPQSHKKYTLAQVRKNL